MSRSWRKTVETFSWCIRDVCEHCRLGVEACEDDDCEHCMELWDDLIERAEDEVARHYREKGRYVEVYLDTEHVEPRDYGKATHKAHVLVTDLLAGP